MDKNEDIALELPGDKNSKSLLVYLKIIFFPVVVFVLVLLGYLGIIELKVGIHTLIMIGFIMCVALIFARHSAQYASSIFEASNEDFKKSLKKYILEHFLKIGNDTKSNASFDEFASFYVLGMRNEQFASIGSSIFPMLGILGTFISIAISMPNFNSSDTTGLENEISLLLSGVGTAFYISIYGIFLALWWMFFEKYGMSKFERLINRQKLATASFFWTKEEIDRRYLQESLKHFDKVSTIFEHVGNEEFFTKLNHTIDRKFQIFEELLATEERAVKISAEHIKLTMGELSKAGREHKDLAKMHSEIVNAVSSLTKSVKTINLHMSEQYNRLLDVGSLKNIELARNLATLDKSVLAFKLGIKEFETLIIKNQKELFEGFRSSIIEGVASFKETYDDEKELDLKLRQVQAFKEESKQLEEKTNEFIKSLKMTKSDEEVDEELKTLDEASEGVEKSEGSLQNEDQEDSSLKAAKQEFIKTPLKAEASLEDTSKEEASKEEDTTLKEAHKTAEVVKAEIVEEVEARQSTELDLSKKEEVVKEDDCIKLDHTHPLEKEDEEKELFWSKDFKKSPLDLVEPEATSSVKESEEAEKTLKTSNETLKTQELEEKLEKETLKDKLEQKEQKLGLDDAIKELFSLNKQPLQEPFGTKVKLSKKERKKQNKKKKKDS